MTIEVYTPPVITPWLLGDAKDHLRVRHTEDDGYIQLLTFAVVNAAEKITRRAIFEQTLVLYLDEFECHEIYLPRPVLRSVTHVKYYDSGGTQQTLSASDYQIDTISAPGRLKPKPNLVWPATEIGRFNAVEIRYVAGWEFRGQLPEALRQAMLYHLSHLYDIREPAVIGTIVANIPYTIQSLYAPFRVVRFY